MLRSTYAVRIDPGGHAVRLGGDGVARGAGFAWDKHDNFDKGHHAGPLAFLDHPA